MGLLISSKSDALRHGAYIIEKTPPLVIQPTGTGVACVVEQFPWGPAQELITPSSVGERLNTFCPPGMDRTSQGYLAISQKGFPILKVVRVAGADAVEATADLPDITPTTVVTLTAKYVGAAGSDLLWEVLDATDGDNSHYNLKVTATNASGASTVDLIQNLTGTSADEDADLSRLLLLGTITVVTPGRPVNGTGTFGGGTDGTITSADYVGTIGTGDKGLSLTESDKTIRHIFFGDPGDSIRAACNAGMNSHVDFLGDRMGYINGDSGQVASAARTDVENYRSIFLVYCDPWCYMFDDVDGTKRLTVPAPFAASMGANLSPSTTIAWKAAEATKFLGAIVALEADRGENSSLNTDAGIATFIKEDRGGFSIEAGVNTEAPIEPSKKSDTRSRMLAYIGRSLVDSVRSFIDAPNVPENQQSIIDAVHNFLDGLKRNVSRDANHNPHILNFNIDDIAAANDDVSLAAGEFSVPASIQLSASMAKLFFVLTIGESVSIRNLG